MELSTSSKSLLLGITIAVVVALLDNNAAGNVSQQLSSALGTALVSITVPAIIFLVLTIRKAKDYDVARYYLLAQGAAIVLLHGSFIFRSIFL